jgi:molybdopterin/thiamine biosynthesis adenylyltransferase
MDRISSVLPTSIRLKGSPISGAEDRQKKIAGFDQMTFAGSRVVCVGAGGLIGFIAPTLVRKGIGALVLIDDDIVEVSNLNRQRFYCKDLGKNKALALAENLQAECILSTEITGHALQFGVAVERGIDLGCNVAICGVDNNPARIEVSRYFRQKKIPVIFTAVSNDGDHGYVFMQDKTGPCIGCLFPDSINDDKYPCPGTPAIADILQVIGGVAVYAVDSCLMSRQRAWNYRRINLSNGAVDSAQQLTVRENCQLEKH